MEKLGKLISPDLYEEYVPIAANQLTLLPFGTVVMVLEQGIERPYRIVKWGKHRKKRLQWMGWLDFDESVATPYLPIRRSRWLKFKAKKKPARLAVRQAFSG